MAGGIQPGTTASTPESKKLDEQVKNIASSLARNIPIKFNLGHEQRYPLWPKVLLGCVPDGGLWLNEHSQVIAAFEAKRQQNGGNAIERQGKNYFICKKHSAPKFKYVTFMTGEGAKPNGVLDRYARTMLYCENDEDNQEMNVLNPKGLSFFLSPQGFTDDQIRDIMIKALE